MPETRPSVSWTFLLQKYLECVFQLAARVFKVVIGLIFLIIGLYIVVSFIVAYVYCFIYGFDGQAEMYREQLRLLKRTSRQADASSAIIIGHITSIMISEDASEFVANVSVASVLKGCAPPDVSIVGSTSVMRFSAKAVESDALFFLCEPDPFDETTYPLYPRWLEGWYNPRDWLWLAEHLEKQGYADGQDDDCLDFEFDQCLDYDAQI